MDLNDLDVRQSQGISDSSSSHCFFGRDKPRNDINTVRCTIVQCFFLHFPRITRSFCFLPPKTHPLVRKKRTISSLFLCSAELEILALGQGSDVPGAWWLLSRCWGPWSERSGVTERCGEVASNEHWSS